MERKSLDVIMSSLEDTSIEECVITSKDGKVRIVRKNCAPKKNSTPVAAAPQQVPSSATVENATNDQAELPTEDVLSDWVGYFYRGTEKDAKPFVKLRDSLKAGQKVGTVVTMNIVHEVHVPIDGKLVEVLVEDGQAVEYGQPLLRIAKS